MFLKYDRAGDAAYIYLVEGLGPGGVKRTYACDPQEVNREINLDFDADGSLVGIEVMSPRELLPPQLLQDASHSPITNRFPDRSGMGIEYIESVDVAYIEFLDVIAPGSITRTYGCDPEQVDGILALHFGTEGRLISIEVHGASSKLPRELLQGSRRGRAGAQSEHRNAEFALIRDEVPLEPIRHWTRLPSGENRQFGRPAVLILEHLPEGFFLFRYDRQGREVGDTWHEDEAAGRRAAASEYGEALGDWTPVPAGTEDVVGYALSSSKEAQD